MTKKKSLITLIILAIIVIALLAWLFLFKGHSSKPSSQTAGQTNKHKAMSQAQMQKILSHSTQIILINQGIFGPSKLTAPSGYTIVWGNMEATTHQIVFDKTPVPVPSSPVLAQGNEFSLKLTKVGIYNYHDGLNPTIKGEVTITK